MGRDFAGIAREKLCKCFKKSERLPKVIFSRLHCYCIGSQERNESPVSRSEEPSSFGSSPTRELGLKNFRIRKAAKERAVGVIVSEMVYTHSSRMEFEP